MKGKLPIIGSIVASLTAVISASCCVIPLILFNLGIGGAWLANLAILQPLRPYLIALSVIALITASVFYWRKPAADCKAYNGTPVKQKRSFILFFAIAALLTITAIILPMIEPDLIKAVR